MNLAAFHQSIEQVWDNIEVQLEEQDCDVDCERQGAVFSITFDDRSQIVINKQEAMFELWLASRLGGEHFAFVNNQWINREGMTFWQALEQACAAHGESVSLHS